MAEGRRNAVDDDESRARGAQEVGEAICSEGEEGCVGGGWFDDDAREGGRLGREEVGAELRQARGGEGRVCWDVDCGVVAGGGQGELEGELGLAGGGGTGEFGYCGGCCWEAAVEEIVDEGIESGEVGSWRGQGGYWRTNRGGMRKEGGERTWRGEIRRGRRRRRR